MMTVREHMVAAGFNPAVAWNARHLDGRGTMECESILIRKFHCRPDCMTDMVGIEATAIVPFSDGYDHLYPSGWPKSLEASLTAYFKPEEVMTQ